jgi:hypothetical protein
MTATAIADIVPILTEPLVRTGLYPNAEEAFKHIVLDHISHQIAWAKKELQQYEQKYGQSFDEWSKSIEGRASVAEEDDWLEWEATLDMLAGWQQVVHAVEQSNV